MRRTSMRRWTLLACAVALPACGNAGAGSAAWTTMVDTLPSGVVHVVNVPPADEFGATWTLEEELRLGSVDATGPESFGQLRGLAVAVDGRIAVLDAQAQEIRVFDAEGAHLATFGGKGEGPGELQEANGLMLGPDGELWVPDHGNARMSVYDLAAGFERSYPMRFYSYGFVWSGAMGADGRVYKPSLTLGPPRRDIIRVYDREMALVDSLSVPEGPELDRTDPPTAFYWEMPGGRGYGYMSVPYYPRTHEVLDARGTVWSTPFGDPSYRIMNWMPGGDTLLILETRRSLVPVTAAERDSAIESIREALLERGAAANQDWSKIPEVKPAVLAIYPAVGGRLWVETASPDALRRYDVYDADGRFDGSLATSLNIYRYIPPVVRGELVWAIVLDELDVPYVVRARVVPALESGEG